MKYTFKKIGAALLGLTLAITSLTGCGAKNAAQDIVEPSPVDDEHMTADGHRKLAQAIFDKIDEMIIV